VLCDFFFYGIKLQFQQVLFGGWNPNLAMQIYLNLNAYPHLTTSRDTPTFGAFLRPYPLTIFAVDGGEVKVLVSCAGLRESFLELSKGIGACDDIKGLYKPQDSVGYKI